MTALSRFSLSFILLISASPLDNVTVMHLGDPSPHWGHSRLTQPETARLPGALPYLLPLAHVSFSLRVPDRRHA